MKSNVHYNNAIFTMSGFDPQLSINLLTKLVQTSLSRYYISRYYQEYNLVWKAAISKSIK